MENNLIKNEDEIRNFIGKVLLPLKDDEVYVVVLIARKKYCSSISSSIEVVSREIIRDNDENKIIRKLIRLGTVEGIYTDKNENIIPEEAFGLYILPEPRSMLKAYIDFVNDINKWNYDNLKGEKNFELYKKLDIKLFSSIHKSKSRSNYFIIDIDKKDDVMFNNIYFYIKSKEHNQSSIIWISETRGGYHIILKRCDLSGKIIHDIMEKKFKFVEFKKESMTPIPGTLQGGFIVKNKDL